MPRWLAAVALLLLATWVFVDRHRFLSGSPDPLGIDGYWYAVQLRSLLDTGHLHYPGAPLALWIMTPLAALTDPVAGVKLGAALAAAALPVAVYALARRIAGERAIALAAAGLAATSAGAFYLPTEFVKSAVGLPIAVAALAALGWALERPSRRRALLPAALLVAAGLCHKLALAFALAGWIAPIAVSLVGRARTSRVRRQWLLLALIAAALALLVAPDPAVRAGLFTAEADWSIPALRDGAGGLHFRGEPALAGAFGLAALGLLILGRRLPALRPAVPAHSLSLAVGPALWAIATALPWLDAGDPQGLTFRLRAIAFLPLALTAAAVAAAVLARLSRSRRMVVFMFATGLLLVRPARYEAPVVRVDPDLAAAVAAAGPALAPGAVIVAPERHIVFMATWYTGAPARLRPEPVPPARRARLIPASYMSEALARAIDEARSAAVAPPVSLHRGHPDGLVLVTEPTWEWLLARLPAAERDHYRAWPVH